MPASLTAARFTETVPGGMWTWVSARAAAQEDVPSATPGQLAALDEILARPEFQAPLGQNLLAEYLARFRNWLWSWLLWLLSPLRSLFGDGVGVDGAAVMYGALAAGIIVLVVVVVLVRRWTRGRLAGDAALADVQAAGPAQATDELARAQALAGAGDVRQAVHHHYLAVLLRLDELDHLRFDGALTNRELLPRLAAWELAEPFEALVARFDRLWYGQTTCSPAEYAEFRQLAARVWDAAGTVPPSRTSRGATGGQEAAAMAPGLRP
ncbi:MAG: DUF4129 domain-containing protein [Chloroflexota bacterium]